MNPLIWIRLVAYGDRVALERQRAYDAVVSGRTGALRSRIIGELRVALDRALARDTGRHASGTVVRSDGSGDGFLMTTRGGPLQRTLRVSSFGAGLECCYGASDAMRDDGSNQGRLQLSFPSQQLIPAVILESGVRTRCDTASVLCEQLLARLKSRDGQNPERRKSGAAATGRKRLTKMRHASQSAARP